MVILSSIVAPLVFDISNNLLSSFSSLLLSNENTDANKHAYMHIQTDRNSHVLTFDGSDNIVCDLIFLNVLLPIKDNVHIIFISCSTAKLFLQANHILNLPTSRKLQTSAGHL